MVKEVKLVHVKIMDGTLDDIKELKSSLKKLEKDLPKDMRFIFSNDKVDVRDIRHLIKELYTLYKQDEKIHKARQKNAKK